MKTGTAEAAGNAALMVTVENYLITAKLARPHLTAKQWKAANNRLADAWQTICHVADRADCTVAELVTHGMNTTTGIRRAFVRADLVLIQAYWTEQHLEQFGLNGTVNSLEPEADTPINHVLCYTMPHVPGELYVDTFGHLSHLLTSMEVNKQAWPKYTWTIREAVAPYRRETLTPTEGLNQRSAPSTEIARWPIIATL